MPGTVIYADWKFTWSIPQLLGQGLVISFANFRGDRVLYRATQPYVLVPYHGNFPTFKDGLNPKCGAVPFKAMTPTAPNAPEWLIPPNDPMLNRYNFATNDNQYDPNTNPAGAVMVEKLPATETEPARAVVWAKLQAVNYQYVHQWEFRADGSIEAKVGLGGRLWTYNALTGGHIHNFYFRLDFDIVTFGNNLVQRFTHKGNNPGDDVWTDINVETKESVDPKSYMRWRVLNKTPKVNGQLRSYELIPNSDGAPDGTYSTGDLWVHRYDPTEDGSHVNCNDLVLENLYASGQAVNGQDVVVWYCLRTHHAPRQLGEEKNVLPYEERSFHIEPRDFLDDTPKNLYATKPPSP